MREIYADFHVHTRFSPCGHRAATVAAMVERAAAKGLAALGFADHVTPEPVPGCGFYDGQQVNVLIAQRGVIDGLTVPTGLEVLMGVEADYTLARERCLSADILARVEHVICSASHFHLPAAPKPAADTPAAKAALMVQMAEAMLQVPGVDVWAHPFDCSAMRPLAPIMAHISNADRARLITLANDREIAVEINGGSGQEVAYREATRDFFGLAQEMGARFTITADAHHPDDFERLDIALAWAREMGLRDEDFLTVAEFRMRRRKRLRH
jgi:histidinol phosphatase-like PHP family hydrolase